ncbi:MAG: hypothetical protein ABR968_08230, partial [Bacteroidales bacterium]
MKKPRSKFIYLAVGVFIGFLVAWSIIWWQGMRSTGEWSFFKKARSYFSNVFIRKDHPDITVINEKPVKQNKPVINKTKERELKNDSAFYDSTNVDLYDPNALDEFLAKYNGHLPDSLVLDSVIKSQKKVNVNTNSNSYSENVKKDKLIFAKAFHVPGLTLFAGDNPSKIDSLLTDNKKSSTPNNAVLNSLKVEFWKSPINYKGYKTGKNKLVVFGLDQFNMISFRILNNTLYMKYLSDFYQIDRSGDFKSLIPINN